MQDIQAILGKRWFVAYCRKSSEPEDKQLQSITDQVKAVKEYCQGHDLPLLKIFSESKSGGNPDRPVFNELINFPKQRPDIKGIIGWSMSRQSRNPESDGLLKGLLYRKQIEQIIDLSENKIYTDANDIGLVIEQ